MRESINPEIRTRIWEKHDAVEEYALAWLYETGASEECNP
jgi:hypothetical protein